jgi:hypothetical protein
VTVAGLALYLDGKEVKSIVGEIYDPRQVGQEPTATLPATKLLGSHKKGAVVTASASSMTNDASSSSDLETEDEAPAPTTSPQELQANRARNVRVLSINCGCSFVPHDVTF